VWSQVPCLAAAVALCTEFTSNVATANVVLGLLAHTAGALQLEPLQLMVPATLGCSFAFMLPVATPPNAIAFATGWIPLRDMLQRGLVMNVVGVGLVGVLMPLLGPALW
jgi:sodium-dependent dicarboxylate transporter 2/3/5